MRGLIEVEGLEFSHGRERGSDARGGGSWSLRVPELTIEDGSTVGIVGESGSGKSTLIRILCGLLPVAAGSATFRGKEIADWLRIGGREFRRQNQLVFQNPSGSFDPRMTMGRSVAEPVKAIERRAPTGAEIAGWLSEVGLRGEILRRYPHELSGGQLQRVAIARALSLRPSVLYADEPTSALDVSVQAQVLNLLMDLRENLGLTLVMVSHDIVVVAELCEYLVVMKDGGIVETGRTDDVMRRPRASYTEELIAAAERVSLR
ncbi:ABC transporter ATP-binding protein [Jiangella asiatica]|nr:ABC transporter ATP-binding protein [Jiangella asiatica]